MNDEAKRDLRTIIVSAVLLAAAFAAEKLFPSLPLWAVLLTYLPAYAVSGVQILAEAASGIKEGEIFGEELLMSIATIGALIIGFLPDGEPMFAEAVFVMLFFRVGELFEGLSEEKSKRSVAELMDIRPDTACVIRNGEEITVSPDCVEVGEVISVRAGEKIPLDGVVASGSSHLNTVALTGESAPRDVSVGDGVISGCINLTGLLTVRVTKEYGESTVAKILELVENSSARKSKSERFIKKFAGIYTPCVIFASLAIAVIPPLLGEGFTAWLLRAMTFLVVSCPCALVISVPLAFFCGIGGAAKRGTLIKGADHIEALSGVGTAVFDKTGTLTEGVFEVTCVHPEICDENTLLHLAAHVERYSTHPIALSLRQAYGNEADDCAICDTREIAGKGVNAMVNGKSVAVGNDLLMKELGADLPVCPHTGTVVHVAIDGVYAGHIVVSDKLKDDSAAALVALKKLGVLKTVMLTGDRRETAKAVADALLIDEYKAELLPADKVYAVEGLCAEMQKGKTLAFIGDGINDAPVLARADVGIAMGALGSDAAIEAADIVIMDDKPSRIADAIKLSRFIMRLVKENIAFALFVKFAVLILAAFGAAPMWLAIFADVGVTVLAILNSMRAI